MNVGVVEFVCGPLADRADFDLVEVGDLLSTIGETFQEIFDAIGAREDKPVVTVEMLERFVESIVVIGLANLDGRANDDFSAVAFEYRGQIGGLRHRARNDYGSPFKWSVHRKFTVGVALCGHPCAEI